MFLYLIERKDEVGWDETRGAVICAETEGLAKLHFMKYLVVPNTARVEVHYIGTPTDEYKEQQVILEDFKAG